MGCGSSTLKGEDLSPMTASKVPLAGSSVSDSSTNSNSNKLNPQSRSQGNQYFELSDDPDLTARRSIPANVENPKFRSSVNANDSSIPPYMINTPAINVTSDPKDTSVTEAVTGPGSSFRSKLSAGSFSFSSPQPKKKQALTEEDLLKYTGMSSEQLKEWGDQRMYKGTKAEVAQGGMGPTWAAGGCVGGY